MTKNAAIILLSVIVLGLGGWLAYNSLSDTGTNDRASSDTTQTQVDGKVLDFSNRGLTKVGPEIYNQTNTASLILSNNNLETLPSQMGAMTKLQVLKLDHNRIEGALIGEIRKMPLVKLDASYNQMTGVPAEIGQLNQLETLNYSYNKITAFPNEIAKLTQLKTLDITGNPLSAQQVQQLRDKLPNTEIIF
jgi:Leucine-rich repeat (LRR) protein